MDSDLKKKILRMIPYGIYVLTARASGGDITAATVNWVTQVSFDPPLVALGVKPDSGAYVALKESGGFALNFLGKGQQGLAFKFFKPAEVSGGKSVVRRFTTVRMGRRSWNLPQHVLSVPLSRSLRRGIITPSLLRSVLCMVVRRSMGVPMRSAYI